MVLNQLLARIWKEILLDSVRDGDDFGAELPLLGCAEVRLGAFRGALEMEVLGCLHRKWCSRNNFPCNRWRATDYQVSNSCLASSGRLVAEGLGA